MKKKLMRMPKVVTILVAILIVAIFLGSMDVAAFFLANTVSLPGYGNSMIAEFAAGVWSGDMSMPANTWSLIS